MTLWHEVDERVLRWVFSLPPSWEMHSHDFELVEPAPFDPIPGLDSRQVHESLARVVSFGLIDGDEGPAMQSTMWSKLRVTARGMIVLGEWPDLDRVAAAAAIHRLLAALAEGAPSDEQPALRRAAGTVAHLGDDVVRGTAADIARTIAKDVVD